MSEEYKLDQPSALTCPECGGAMSTEESGTLLQFRCHIGHVLTAETMLAAQFAALEVKLGACLMALNERAELCRLMIETLQKSSGNSDKLHAAREEALERATKIKELLESEWKLAARPEPLER
jgi:two-component system chemotaxis response regulator CheB